MKEEHIFRLTGRGADQDPKGVFSINRLSGDVAVSRALDREAIAYYHVSAILHLLSSAVHLSLCSLSVSLVNDFHLKNAGLFKARHCR